MDEFASFLGDVLYQAFASYPHREYGSPFSEDVETKVGGSGGYFESVA
jgi:hypothetical protein